MPREIYTRRQAKGSTESTISSQSLPVRSSVLGSNYAAGCRMVVTAGIANHLANNVVVTRFCLFVNATDILSDDSQKK